MLEREAVELYKLAIVHVRRCEDVALLGTFREAHDDLARVLEGAVAGRQGVRVELAGRTTGHDWATFGALTRDAERFEFLEAFEAGRERIYWAALRADVLFGTARELLNGALEATQKRRLALRARG